MGMPLIGRYRGYKSGHALHNDLLNALFADEDCFELIDLASDASGSGRRIINPLFSFMVRCQSCWLRAAVMQ